MKTQYKCQECGAIFLKWQGQCSSCKVWDSVEEIAVSKAPRPSSEVSWVCSNHLQSLHSVEIKEDLRVSTKIDELDRVLGGGLIMGSVTLLGGQPGAGKSTLILQTLANLSAKYKTLYISGEESAQQIAMRAERLGLKQNNIDILIETRIEVISEIILKSNPQFVVVDSIQVMQSESSSSVPGSVSQVRESANILVQIAKRNNIAMFIIGHVTKEGAIAGPKILEHCVDSSLMMESMTDNRFRTIRAQKNRFGAVNELGVFAMSESGLKEVKNPSSIFLQSAGKETLGSVVTVLWEGSRPLLIEIQSLVDKCMMGQPRRLAVGFDPMRVAMLLAVTHRHGDLFFSDQDVFVNIVGGVKTDETCVDLALILSLASSFRNKVFPSNTIVFGEIGLSGEVRPAPYGQERIGEAQKHGFVRALVPAKNVDKHSKFKNIEVVPISNIRDALSLSF